MVSPTLQRDASIDGLRGLSISLVILGHLVFYRLGASGPSVTWKQVLANHLTNQEHEASLWLLYVAQRLARDLFQALAGVGVEVFFVISGFLITGLLMAQERGGGRIRIGAFYLRRAFRILPAFAVMLTATVLLTTWDVIRLPDGAALRSALFTCNWPGVSCGWWLGHTWSLAVEEQFYLAWPWLFLLAPRVRVPLIVTLAVCVPVLGVVVKEAAPFGAIAVGAAFASCPRLPSSVAGCATRHRVWLAMAVIVAAPLWSLAPGGQGMQRLLQPWLVGFVVFATLAGVGPLHALVRQRFMQRIGLVSYSLYLWQQLSLAPRSFEGVLILGDLYVVAGPITAVLFVAPALASYAIVERPLAALGRRISRRRASDAALQAPRAS